MWHRGAVGYAENSSLDQTRAAQGDAAETGIRFSPAQMDQSLITDH
jgi:hypothetical protein